MKKATKISPQYDIWSRCVVGYACLNKTKGKGGERTSLTATSEADSYHDLLRDIKHIFFGNRHEVHSLEAKKGARYNNP